MKKVDYEQLPVLSDEDVILRPIKSSDTDLIVKWRNNPSVIANFVYREPMTAAIHENWFRTKVLTGKVIQYIILEKNGNTPVGSIYFRDIDFEHNHAEYGIFIGEDKMRRKGLGRKASKLFINFGMTILELHKIYLRVFSENYAAINLYSSIGFQLEGIAKDLVIIDGKYKTMFFMAITMQE